MPALPNVPGVIRVAYGFTIGEDLAAKCHTDSSYSGAAPTNSELVTFAAAIAAAFNTDMMGAFTSNRVLTSITVTDLTTPTSAVGVWTGSHAGTDTGTNMPADACVLMSRKVARRFRGGHSRVYWPMGATDTVTDPQKWSATFIAGVQSAWATYSTAFGAAVWSGGGTLQGVNISYYEGFTVHTGVTGRARNVATVRATPLVDNVTSEVFQQGIASQRKRLLRLA